MALHTMQYWWLHRWKWSPHTIALEFAPMCAPEKARKHQKSDWCRFICGTDVSVIIVMDNGGRWLYIVLVQRTLSLVHKTHHLAPQQPTSLKPIRPTTVFTRIGFHQRCNARKWSTYGWCFVVFSEIVNWTKGEVIFHFEIIIIAGILKWYSNLFRF